SQPAPDPQSGCAFLLSQQAGATVIYAYNLHTFTLKGSQTIPGVNGTPQHLVRWGTNGLAFSTTGNQMFLLRSALVPVPSSAQLAVSQTAPASAVIGSTLAYNTSSTNLCTCAATYSHAYDVISVTTRLVI